MSIRPPGPKGVPLFGNSRQYANDPFSFMQACADAYGDVVRFDLGPIDTYMLTNPRDIERVLVSDAARYQKLDLGDDAIYNLLGDGLLMSEGATWEKQRQLANPAFRMNRITKLGGMMTDHTDAMLSGWADGDRIDAQVEMARVTVKIIVNAMFGTEIADERIRAVQENLEPLGARFEPDPTRFLVPNWAPTPENRQFDGAIETLETLIDELVAERRETGYHETEDGEVPMDLLSIILRAIDDGEQTTQSLRDEMMTMLLAGHDTTALTLTYTWYLLSEHPEARDKLHAELAEVLDGKTPTAADTRKLEYTEWVLNEAMRLYPPVYTLFREPKIDVKLGGYRIPEGAGIMLPQWVVHRSPRWYTNPDQFEPERWAPKRRSERPRFAFFPFGGGPRHCIGKQFSMLEAKLILAMVAQEYELDYLGKGEFGLRGSLTMHPQEPMAMRLTKRS
ncbi:cytochrome P450 [Natronocalculus amylovorans]|uniref:Cytochrome P450 n=1 Tax=Natronocalculus amylovorans TaxID=2917812 RepID=A0AAE3FVE8_9EURY|nr:cytochrome P450 [Natronocalculus amylovorans]MCL9816038.1 cytochrome P450 [Natronocalculus amylovorans]NUE01445.1 cytochrome P450 [Halorubraceae archaeon YAN]